MTWYVFLYSYDIADITVCIASKGLTAAVLNTSKMFEEVGDLYAKQVNTVTLTALFIMLSIYPCSMTCICLQWFDNTDDCMSGRASGV